LIFSLYNPAHLIERLTQAGFNVRFIENEKRFEVTKSLGDKTAAIEGFDYFVSLVVHQLFPEETVVQMIENTIEQMERENLPDYSKVELHICQHLLA
jgi:Fic family protein